MSITASPSFPHSTTWSILKALEHLSPPPSDIDLAALSVLPSSGDIPLLIHDGIQLCESLISDPGSAGIPNAGDTAIIQPSHSCGTIGTFGPIFRGLRRQSAAEPGACVSGGGGIVPSCTSTPPKGPRDSKRTSADEYSISIQDSPLQLKSQMCSIGPEYVQNDERMLPPLAGALGDEPEPPSPVEQLLVTPSHSFSTLPTPVFAPASPVLSITPESSPDRRFARRLRTVVHKGVSYVASRSSPTSGPGTPASLKDAGLFGSAARDKDGSPSISMRRRPRSGSTSTTNSEYTSPCARVAPAPAPGPKISNTSGPLSASSLDLLKFGLLPVSMAWLKETTISLSIDQEGFRTVRPDFKLVGYTGPPEARSSPTLAAHLSLGRADFIPTRRQAFLFHHAPLDTPPVLRRLLINGDESHDYTARQALLSVKTPGAYSVRGAETCHLSPSNAPGASAGEPVALSWQFDYLVGDRAGGAGGATGEKTLTPLRFVCSPGLVHPLHGKKVRLMQVFRKSVVPKLAAEKLAPPPPPWTSDAAAGEGTPARAKAFLVGHRRAKSQAQAQALALKHAEVNVPRDRDGGRPAKALCASSSCHASMLRAGGGAQPVPVPEFAHVRDSVQRMGMVFQDHAPPAHHQQTHAPQPQRGGTPGRYILPRDVLASMFAEPLEAAAAQSTGAGPAGVLGTHMMPLSPPKYHHARRASLSAA